MRTMANEQVNSVNAAGKKPRSSWGIYIAAMLIAGLLAGFISLFLLADSWRRWAFRTPAA